MAKLISGNSKIFIDGIFVGEAELTLTERDLISNRMDVLPYLGAPSSYTIEYVLTEEQYQDFVDYLNASIDIGDDAINDSNSKFGNNWGLCESDDITVD